METEMPLTEARKRWSEITKRCHAGERFTFTRRGRPVVRMVPVEDEVRTVRLTRAEGPKL